MFFTGYPQSSAIEHIWLGYENPGGQTLVISWQSPDSGDAGLEVTCGEAWHFSDTVAEHTLLHHLAVPLPYADSLYRYQVRTGNDTSGWYTFRSLPADNPLRVAVISNWGYAGNADMSAVLAENPSLIMTCGDNVPDLYRYGEQGDIHCTESFLRLVEAHPALFRSIPFMPATGNHDKQIYPRGSSPPEDHMVYDTNATAFRDFFTLPDSGWKWMFRIPEKKLRFIAVDLQHLRDYGTNWQTCHAYDAASDQFIWYKEMISEADDDFVITLYNAMNNEVRHLENGIWNEWLNKGDLVVSGYGYYAEVALPGTIPFFNTSLKAGDVYADPLALFTEAVANYVLITSAGDSLSVAIKTLGGSLLYDTVFHEVTGISGDQAGDPPLSLYPNPVGERLTLQLNNEWTGDLRCKIWDMNGEIRKTMSMTKQGRTFCIRINTEDLSAGLYVLMVGNNKERLYRKFIKQ